MPCAAAPTVATSSCSSIQTLHACPLGANVLIATVWLASRALEDLPPESRLQQRGLV